ncbi:MAG: ribosome hibernation-promoting factor, HPF/YfiA family [Chloroflexota bacterium]
MKRSRDSRELQVDVKGKNLTVTPALNDLAVEKMQRLAKYLDRVHRIDVELSTENSRGPAQKNHVQASTLVAGRTIRVVAARGEMYAAIDEAVDKLYARLHRQKERMKAHHASRISDALVSGNVLPPDPVEAQIDDEGEPGIRVEYLDLKPMFDEEAVDELNEQGREFLVFLNASNESVNVLYRRPDGDYGLIEPRVR